MRFKLGSLDMLHVFQVTIGIGTPTLLSCQSWKERQCKLIQPCICYTKLADKKLPAFAPRETFKTNRMIPSGGSRFGRLIAVLSLCHATYTQAPDGKTLTFFRVAQAPAC